MPRLFLITFVLFMSCGQPKPPEENRKMVQLITLDPGHFHAALVQKSMYEDIDSVVHVYAPQGPDLQLHLDRIKAFNTRATDPTHWSEDVYSGDDYLQRMATDKAGNVVVIAGNNLRKGEYIEKSLEAGFNVLADKPMAIDKIGFEQLKKAFEVSEQKNLLLYDIMTERFEITTILQRELSRMPDVFGALESGTQNDPAVVKQSVHYFHKNVSGAILQRPPWFMDVAQAGEGIVDVTTHLVDLVQWECFPETSIDYQREVNVHSGRRWSTSMSRSQFAAITKMETFPDYLTKYVSNDSVLNIFCNGEIEYSLKGVHAKVTAIWNYKAAEGAGDSHYSMLRGTKASLVIRQDTEEKFIPTLYIEQKTKDPEYSRVVEGRVKVLASSYPGIELKRNDKGWEVIIPTSYRDGHEAHFARVMQNYLQYLKEGKLPAWEVPNMMAKYYTTTTALEIALAGR